MLELIESAVTVVSSRPSLLLAPIALSAVMERVPVLISELVALALSVTPPVVVIVTLPLLAVMVAVSLVWLVRIIPPLPDLSTTSPVLAVML